MPYALLITINAVLSALAVGVVAGCIVLARRLSPEPERTADWRAWGASLPVALAADEDEPVRYRPAA